MSKDKKRLVPVRRFKEFENSAAWEQRKLGEVVNLRGRIGFRGYKQTDLVDKGQGAISFSPADIDEFGNVLNCNNKYISWAKYDESPEIQIAQGDILFTKTASIGKIGYITKLREKATINPQIALITPLKNENGYFIFLSLRLDQFTKKVRNIIGGSSVPTLSQEKLKLLTFMYPDTSEQKEIGDFFKQLDSLIALHQRKLDKLKRVKSAYLTEMFPAEGEREPKRRFPGFTGAWEQRKLGEVADVRDGTHDSPKYINEGYPLLTSKNVGDGYINYDDVKYVSENDYVQINKRSKVDVNDILMGMIGTIGNLALIREEPDFAIKNVALIKHTSNFDYQFLFQELQTSAISKELLSGMDGGTQKFVSLKKIRNLSVMLPSENEQKKIESYLMRFDSLIALHQRKLDKLKKMKAAYLEEMFV